VGSTGHEGTLKRPEDARTPFALGSQTRSPVLTLAPLVIACGAACSRLEDISTKEHSMRRVVDAPTVANLPYSAAVVAGGLCFVSGQFGTDEQNRPVGDVERQTAIALDHLESVLQRAGSGLDQLVRVTVWLRRLEDFDAMNRTYRARFPSAPPARVTVAVDHLLFDAAVEIDAIAAMPEQRTGAR
jgi:2-iminobutanoate/2-iminopropanoate deaminase